MRKVKQHVPLGEAGGGLRQPLAGLGALRERLAAREPAETEDAGDAAAPGGPAPHERAVAPSPYVRARQLVVRRERRGHGGRTATRIEGLAGSASELDAVLRELRRALGCGAALDGDDVVVQGAPGDRLLAFLAARGARKVIVGS